jgi:hypothetical protein
MKALIMRKTEEIFMKKKVSIIAISGAVLALGALAIVPGIENNNALVGLDATGETCEHVGNHYAAVSGEYTPGVNEYYVCCKCHEHFVPSSTAVTGFTLANGTDSTASRTCPGSLNGSARLNIDGSKFGFWENDCGYVGFASPLTVATGAKLQVSLTVTCDSPLSSTVSIYPITATDWSTNRVDLPVTVGGTSTISIPLTGTPSFLSGTTVPGFFISTPLMTWYSVASGSVVGNKSSYVTVNSIKVVTEAPAGTWTDATLPDDVKNAIMADSTDTRYAAPTLGTQSAVSGYTCENGTDSTASRTCPTGLVGSVRASLNGNKFGFWENDCGYVNFTTPLTITTGSKLEINLSVECASPVGTSISFYPLSAGGSSWGSNRVDLSAPAGATTTVILPLTDTPTFVSGTTVPGFFISAVLENYWNVSTSSARTGSAAYVTVNSIKLDLNYN